MLLRSMHAKKKIAKGRMVAYAIIVAIVSIGGLGVWRMLDTTRTQQIDTKGYQVVYLISGQTYFGKLQNQSGDYLVLKQVYAEQTVQAAAKNEDGTPKAPQTTLVKVRDQVYGPEDSIAIKSTQVAFWQNLRSDSKISQAIDGKSN